MRFLNALQFRKSGAPAPAAAPAPVQPVPTTEGWHPDIKAGTLRWHGPNGVPTDRLAKWHD